MIEEVLDWVLMEERENGGRECNYYVLVKEEEARERSRG